MPMFSVPPAKNPLLSLAPLGLFARSSDRAIFCPDASM